MYALAKEFGVRPSEIIAGSFTDYLTDAEVLRVGHEERERAQKRAQGMGGNPAVKRFF